MQVILDNQKSPMKEKKVNEIHKQLKYYILQGRINNQSQVT